MGGTRLARARTAIRFLKLRLLLDTIHSLCRGWLFRITGRKAPERPGNASHLLAEMSLAIAWREELADVNYSRIHNMGLGCELVNQVVLKPGEIFSLRRFIGAATEEQGFQKGPMFIRGRTEFAAGGGICLISTLLFNAALKANLRILEKHNHSTDFWGEDRFIDLGLDATYVYGRKDLKFKNTHHGAIWVQAWLSRESLMLHCQFYSDQAPSAEVAIATKVLEELAPPAEADRPDGQQRAYRKGWVVVTERQIRQALRHAEPQQASAPTTTYRKKERYKPYYLS